ncbi:peptidyl-alpha-hydroxyglycine alpha-amidating lyase family protein [Caballeronia sp. SEWSISQ10-4 2]|uniref:peptidyl-alpha-hydroxyglycine alpha-amidating lyase family protein n=1 Tax=Caballeronia sp. SEWSISQ10-4 2 TaxID=2937438 RepID=UPI00264ADED5|nr:peptidyl-alpha-hydroxyglycine alpha-amidating lyase family protein [Caballeronia sp. SEWSISQ10-4 2]MDN7182313.1 peptidyl-alpha-hydroxyglycine alpha-amidating lyase family protein [Caballeronia sp. SEWSISQ10-4 2]
MATTLSGTVMKNKKERDPMIQGHPISCPCCGDPQSRLLTRRRFLALAGEGAAALALLPRSAYAAEAPPVITYDSIPDPLHLPRDVYFGECSGVALNSKGHIFVLSRGNSSGPAYGAAAAQLLEFAPNGRFVREIGRNLYAWSFAHTVKVDREDNIWVTDKGSDMVIKFTPDGRVAMVFGRKQEAADEETGPLKHPNPPLAAEPGRFRQVTDVAWDTEGNTYISDGYINSRVAKVDKYGNWLKSWGERGTGPGQFHTPHSIALDAKGLVYVADRSNRRIQVFDGEGNFQRQFTIDVPVPPGARPAIGYVPDEAAIAAGTFAPGSPWAICISPGPHQVLYSSDGFPGRIYKLSLDGEVLGVLGESGKQLKQFGWIHEMACPSENVLFVAELLNWRVQKLVLHS